MKVESGVWWGHELLCHCCRNKFKIFFKVQYDETYSMVGVQALKNFLLEPFFSGAGTAYEVWYSTRSQTRNQRAAAI